MTVPKQHKSVSRGKAKPGLRGTVTLRVEMEPDEYAILVRDAKRRRETLRTYVTSAIADRVVMTELI